MEFLRKERTMMIHPSCYRMPDAEYFAMKAGGPVVSYLGRPLRTVPVTPSKPVETVPTGTLDAMLASAVTEGTISQEQVPVLRAQSNGSLGWLRGYMGVLTSRARRATTVASPASVAAERAPVMPTAAVQRTPPAPTAPAKKFEDYTTAELQALYHRDRAEYRRLKDARDAASQAHAIGADVPANATWAGLSNMQKHWLAHHDRPRFDKLLAEHSRSGR